MMKVVFDSNVLLDAIGGRADYEVAQNLFLAVAQEMMEGYVTANSVTDIYYISKKILGDADARTAIRNLIALFDVIPIDGEICENALDLSMSDFEDAIVSVCASDVDADYIVTRDDGFLKAEGNTVTAINPYDLFSLLSDEETDTE
ncbi:MAG: PIN domain-containing protein [Lachnospiraceae bacterium]|nr:PIN domain-containing protein [Lachnospiraceae bacterium]